MGAACMVALVAFSTVTLGACSRDGRTLAPALPEQTESVAIAPTDTTVSLTPSDDFSVTGPWIEGGEIDLAFTCYGRKVSPPLEIIAQPGGTVSMAVLLHAVDAPDEIVWLVANLAGGTVALGEGALPPDVVVATNSDGSPGYSPPCPASGERRQYLLTVFALDTRLDVANVTAADGTIDSEQLLTAVEMATFDLAEATFYVQAP
ncbi:MAG: YbhB/YbcL family Raf kinase inhibitor-like protein [Actinobacteria bacterium]|nr:YbhB/YbcL family Raf kinase inhibitor-like protein [Actinomycetota bacterium]NCY08823.1 YbhB/YbcL family Raf kinase inhibitor-like protein [Actinomycetota bacterium]